MHIPNTRRKMPREGQPQRNPPAPPGPVPTLGELQTGSTKWVWAICNGLDEGGRVACLHRAEIKLQFNDGTRRQKVRSRTTEGLQEQGVSRRQG